MIVCLNAQQTIQMKFHGEMPFGIVNGLIFVRNSCSIH